MRNARSTKSDAFIVVTSDDAKFSNPNRLASSAHEALQRGKACLGCRRRKMRCDGLRPICTQCNTRNRIDDCEYTDAALGPTRTQILEETLARLQARVRELEKPPSGSNSPASDPDLSTPCSSTGPSFFDMQDIESKPNVNDLPEFTGEASFNNMISPGPQDPEPVEEPQWWELEEPPPQIANMLIRLFLPNSYQLGFALNVTRFLNSLSEPPSHPMYPHPGLMNVIYLWALRLSNERSLFKHESVYLRRAISALQNTIGGGLSDPSDDALPTKVLHVMQAEVLVAQYFFTHGRILEGRYHANAAVSLAVSYGFHRISPSSCAAPSQKFQVGTSSSLGLLTQTFPPVKTCVEYGERVNLFWSVYNVDRCWSVIGNPCIMSDDPTHGTQIDTPWPWDMHEYEMADMNTGTLRFSPCDRTIQRFLLDEAPPDGVSDLSFAALRVKASAIHERVTNLTAAWRGSRPGTIARENIEREMNSLSNFLFRFIASLPDVEHLEDKIISSDCRRTVYVVHSLVYTSVIILHETWAEDGDGNQAESDICLEAAHHISRVPRIGVELGLLDPVLGTTGMILASLFVREVLRARRTANKPEAYERLRRIEEGMQFLKDTAIWGQERPVYGLQVPKILAVLAKAEKRK